RIADLMTDKATVEMESPVAGIVREVAGAAGDVIAIGSPLVVIETDGDEDAAEAPTAPQEVAAAPAPVPVVPTAPEPVNAPSEAVA
ncbi:biotin/lipoyl-containing protein, partial [Acinetobacter baumannii]